MFFTKLLLPLFCVTSVHALSDQCVNETEAVNANGTAVANATATMKSETAYFIPHTDAVKILMEPVPEEIPQDCIYKDNNATIQCVYDYGPAAASLVTECEAAGGKVFKDEYKFVCQALNDRRSELNYLNYTMCVSATCDDDNVTKAWEESLEDDEEEIESPTGYNCLLLHEVDHSLYGSGSFVIKPMLLGGAGIVSCFFLFI